MATSYGQVAGNIGRRVKRLPTNTQGGSYPYRAMASESMGSTYDADVAKLREGFESEVKTLEVDYQAKSDEIKALRAGQVTPSAPPASPPPASAPTIGPQLNVIGNTPDYEGPGVDRSSERLFDPNVAIRGATTPNRPVSGEWTPDMGGANPNIHQTDLAGGVNPRGFSMDDGLGYSQRTTPTVQDTLTGPITDYAATSGYGQSNRDAAMFALRASPIPGWTGAKGGVRGILFGAYEGNKLEGWRGDVQGLRSVDNRGGPIASYTDPYGGQYSGYDYGGDDYGDISMGSGIW